MNHSRTKHRGHWLCGGIVLLLAASLAAMEPPTPAQVRQYKADGTFTQRVARAHWIGNHRTNSALAARTQYRLRQAALKAKGGSKRGAGGEGSNPAPPPIWQGGLPAKGAPRVPVLLVDFPDYPHAAEHTVADVQSKFFGDGDASQYPYESLRNFYQRSSYNQLSIQGDVLGWYTARNNRSYYQDLGDGPGQEALMMETLDYFDSQGHDFTPYDNDGDGVIDALFIKWTGPDNGWANFWWAYQWTWHSTPDYRIDGKALRNYVWSWIANPNYDGYTVYQPHVDIHETGHLLGLPDLYDYSASAGPKGGVGGLDMMDRNWGDHNCFSKFMLEWLTPATIVSGAQTLALGPAGAAPDCVLVMPGRAYTPGTIYDEFFMVQYRKRGVGNDPSTYPNDGYTIWHVDSTLNGAGTDFLYDNSYTTHKMVRLMEADGLEEIERGLYANAGDFYTAPATFGLDTTPSSRDYAGALTGVQVDELTTPGVVMAARFSIIDLPVITTAGSTLVAESCQPGNGAIDNQEAVTINLGLRNTGVVNATNLVATLLPTGGVTMPSGPQTYGALPAGGHAINMPFTFVASAACGSTLTVTLQLTDGALTLDSVSFTFPAGEPTVPLAENFDALTPPALPAGWSATVPLGSAPTWATSTQASDSTPNSVFAVNAATKSDNRLDSPTFPITTTTAQLNFRHRFNLENGYDGGALEIAIGTGAFQDILAAGGSFASGGYTHLIAMPWGNPLGGRQAWTGDSSGFITTIVNLPAAAAGQSIRFRWRLGTDDSWGETGWYVDSIWISDGYTCCTPPPSIGDMDGDGDVDQEDFGLLQACFTGRDFPQNDPNCRLAKMDADGDVDEDDVSLFVKCLSGPAIPADSNCRSQ